MCVSLGRRCFLRKLRFLLKGVFFVGRGLLRDKKFFGVCVWVICWLLRVVRLLMRRLMRW